MPKLNKSDLRLLLNKTSPAPLISIYTPTHSATTPPNISEDRRRFKNLRSKVMEVIKATPSINLKSSQAIEHQLTALDEDLSFWESRTFGVGIFVNPDEITTVDLPIDCDEYIAVDSKYHTVPLVGLLSHMVEYAVLVVSKKQPMLFMGDMYGLSSTSVILPTAQTSRHHEQTKQRAAVHVPPKGDGNQEHFGDNFSLLTQDDVLHFYRAVDRIVRKHVPKKTPLILAGTETDTTDYRSISTYPNILDSHIESINSATTPHYLAPFAWALVHKIVQKDHQNQLERFDRLSNGKQRASQELAAIQDAAEKGRIETLIIKLIRTTTDTIRDNKVATPKIHFPPDEQMSVIEKVALQTWQNQGTITLIEDTETTPPNAALGAIFRY